MPSQIFRSRPQVVKQPVRTGQQRDQAHESPSVQVERWRKRLKPKFRAVSGASAWRGAVSGIWGCPELMPQLPETGLSEAFPCALDFLASSWFRFVQQNTYPMLSVNHSLGFDLLQSPHYSSQNSKVDSLSVIIHACKHKVPPPCQSAFEREPHRMPADSSMPHQPWPASSPAVYHRKEAKEITEPPNPGSESLRLGLRGALEWKV